MEYTNSNGVCFCVSVFVVFFLCFDVVTYGRCMEYL
jgi:hypothetical protein